MLAKRTGRTLPDCIASEGPRLCRSSREGELDLFGLAGAVELLERAARDLDVVFRHEARHEARRKRIGEAVADAVFALGWMQVAHATVELAVQARRALRLEWPFR